MKCEIRDEIDDMRCASPGVLRDFCDGEFVKTHPLVQQNPDTPLLVTLFRRS